MTTKPTDIGSNRTGAARSPLDAKKLKEHAAEGVPAPSFDNSALAAVRDSYAQSAEPVGTMPPPADIKGLASTVVARLKGEKLSVFLDLLGERLAFERTGTRLYEGLLVKLDAAHLHQGSPSRQELEVLRDQELAHFAMLTGVLEDMGGDPTAMTPSADLAGVAASGIVQVVNDPRTTLTECMKAILVAELTDRDGWQALVDLATELGQDEAAQKFSDALREEEEHLRLVRDWTETALRGELGLAPTPRRGAQPPASAP